MPLLRFLIATLLVCATSSLALAGPTLPKPTPFPTIIFKPAESTKSGSGTEFRPAESTADRVWVTVVDPCGSFTVMFPVAPTVESLVGDLGKRPIVRTVYSANAGSVRFSVQVDEMSTPALAADVIARLANDGDSAAVDVDGHKGREFRRSSERVRAFAADSAVIVIATDSGASASGADLEAAPRFLASLRFLP